MIRKRIIGIAAHCITVLLALGVYTSASANAQESETRDDWEILLDEAPHQQSSAGAHSQSDPHAALTPEKLAQVALQHLDEARTKLALDTLNIAIDKYKGNTMLLSLRASLHLQNQRTSLALTDLNRAVELNPHDPVLLTNRAQALRQFRRSEDALRDLGNAIELNPEFVAALFNRGSLYFEARKYDQALADFNRCIELEPEVAAAYFNRASTFDAVGNRERAIGDLQYFMTLPVEPGWLKIAEELLKQWQADLS